MANSKGSTNVRNLPYMGKQSLLPPKSPYPCTSPSYLDYCPVDARGSRVFPRARDGNSYHQRTSSENHLIEEQPSWLDELLNEPETPQCKAGGHRRASSDSFAYIDATDASKIDYAVHARLNPKNLASVPSWGSQELDYYKDVQRAHFYKELNSLRNSMPLCPKKNMACEHTYKSMPYRSSHSSARDTTVTQRSGSVFVPQDSDSVSSTGSEKQDQAEAGLAELKCSSERKDCLPKPLGSEADTKRTKQQFAQRSRVRKLQYIAELERNVQALQVEGSEVSAELEFVNQQSIILSMENKALKQRLESLSQEKLIKYMEHEVLEKEIGRLRAVYQQQQHQLLLSSSSHQRSTGRGLDSQFARLSLKHEANTGSDSVAGALGI